MEKNIKRKKAYSKPCVDFVDFSLTGSIAASCKYEGTNTDGQTCGYVDNGWTVYAVQGVCNIIIQNPDFCYHVPTEDTSVFSS